MSFCVCRFALYADNDLFAFEAGNRTCCSYQNHWIGFNFLQNAWHFIATEKREAGKKSKCTQTFYIWFWVLQHFWPESKHFVIQFLFSCKTTAKSFLCPVAGMLLAASKHHWNSLKILHILSRLILLFFIRDKMEKKKPLSISISAISLLATENAFTYKHNIGNKAIT